MIAGFKKRHLSHLYLKWYVPIAFSSPRAQPEVPVVLFWCQMKAHIFLIITPKFQLQIHYGILYLVVTTENVPISGIPILIFLCIFISASSSVSHTYFCPRREIRSNLEVKFVQNVSQGSRSISYNENTHVKIGTCLFKKVCNCVCYS